MGSQPDTNAAPWTIGRLLSWTGDYFARREVEEPRLSAEVLLAHALGCRRIDLYARFENQPEPDRVKAFRELVKRAGDHEPIAYLVGEKEFFSLSFRVTPDVLIPRPETETLVEVVADHCRARAISAPRIFDLGTGSGCIVIALLTQLPQATAVASDVSPAALDIARENAERHEVADRVTFVEADRFAIPAGVAEPGTFDLVVSNPPYVSAAEMETLAANVRDHEPQVALTDGDDGLGDDGLGFFRALGDDGAKLLKSDGALMVEVAAGQAQHAIETVTQSSRLIHRKTVKDRVLGHDRVVVFEAGGA